MASKLYRWSKMVLGMIGLFAWGSCSRTTDVPVVLLYQPGNPVGVVTGINGIYGPSCKDRVGAWSWSGSGACGALPNAPLSIEPGDDKCTLLIQSVVINCQTYQTHGLPIEGDIQLDGFPFYKEGSCVPDFYGNGYIQISNGRVVIRFVYASDLNNASGSAVARYGTVKTLVIDDRVPAPDYIPDLSAVHILVDANHVVTDVNGLVSLIPGLQTGEWYALVPQIPSAQRTYNYVHSIFPGLIKAPVSVPISAALFQLMGKTLTRTNPIQWDLIVSHEENGVFSYELIGLVFVPPLP